MLSGIEMVGDMVGKPVAVGSEAGEAVAVGGREMGAGVQPASSSPTRSTRAMKLTIRLIIQLDRN